VIWAGSAARRVGRCVHDQRTAAQIDARRRRGGRGRSGRRRRVPRRR
jgi:hypothetical protein